MDGVSTASTMPLGAGGARPQSASTWPTYEPPRVERVVTTADLAHEVMYAGPAIVTGDEHT